MAILDYQARAKKDMKDLLDHPKLSQANKEHLKRFFKVYDVSPARIGIFCRHIIKLLENSKDIVKDMNDREKINSIFKKLRDNLSPSYYSTIINVSLRFVRWLNDDAKPKGFKDIKNLPKKKQQRSLKPSDMISWKEGLLMTKKTQSYQLQAMLLVQLDGGFRPSEFTDLNYGDIERKGHFINVHLRDGKTGSRIVWLFKSVPALQRWLKLHPTKEPNDPLWITEHPQKSDNKRVDDISRFEYPSFQRRIRELAQKANIKKPMDFYSLRHSACTISKLENIPVDLAASKFGHSVEYYVDTYGRLTNDDQIRRVENHLNKTQSQISTKICESCRSVNPPKTKICETCGQPLTVQEALKSKEGQVEKLQEEVKEIKKNMQSLQEIHELKQIAELMRDPKNREFVKGLLKSK